MGEQVLTLTADGWLRRHWWQATALTVALAAALAWGFWPGPRASVSGDTPEERASSIGAMVDEGHAGAGEAVAGVVRDASPRVREAAMAALGRLKQRPDLVRMGLHDPDPTVRYAAAHALGGMPASDAPDAADVLGELAANGPDALTRKGALMGLARAGTPRAAVHIVRTLDTPDPEVARTAMEVLTAMMSMRWDVPPDPANRTDWAHKVSVVKKARFIRRAMEASGG